MFLHSFRTVDSVGQGIWHLHDPPDSPELFICSLSFVFPTEHICCYTPAGEVNNSYYLVPAAPVEGEGIYWAAGEQSHLEVDVLEAGK